MTKKRSAEPEAQLKRAMKALEGGQHKRALQQLERLLPVVEADPVLAEQIHLAMADACLSLRELPRAVRHAEAVLALNAESDGAYYFLGFAYSVQNDWDRAIPALRQALTLNPDEPEYYRSLGWALFNQGGAKQEGQELLEQALHMAPAHLPTLTDLAMLHGQEQQFDQALIYARRAVQLVPSNSQAQEILATLTHFKQEFERLGGKPAAKPLPEPSTEAEWRALIAATDDYQQLMQRWLDLHPARDLDEINASLQQLNDLWNSTPRPELGGRSPNEMMGRPAKKT